MFSPGASELLSRRVLEEEAAQRPENTKKAYEPKLKEFIAFCDEKFRGSSFPRQVTEEKVFAFMYFQSHRKKKRGGKKRPKCELENDGENGTNATSSGTFDVAEFDKIMQTYLLPSYSEKGEPEEAQWHPEDGMVTDGKIGLSTFDQYWAAIKGLWHEQVALHQTPVRFEQLYSTRLRALKNTVKTRRVRERKATHQEKVDNTVSPYLDVSKIDALECLLFKENAQTPIYSLANLRNRFTFLMTYNGILRGESVYKANLSELFTFSYAAKGEIDPYEVLGMKIEMGKVNQDRTILGRVLRHVDVKLCAFGALGLYLLQRFLVTNELGWLDFTTNKSWFDIKLLVDVRGGRNGGLMTRKISERPYSEKIARSCAAVGIESQHQLHIGRSKGPIKLEMEEVDPEWIRALGNWNIDTQQESYSSKIPLKSMRVAAGFAPAKGTHYNPRIQLLPPEELQKMVFPELERLQKLVYETSAKLQNANPNSRCKRSRQPLATSRCFLRFLEHMRRVILQDVAVMMLEGRSHFVFSLPVFRSKLFMDFKAKMAQHLEQAKHNNPLDASIEVVLPGVQERINNVATSVNGVKTAIEQIASNQHKLLLNQQQLHDNMLTKNYMEDYIQRMLQHMSNMPRRGGAIVADIPHILGGTKNNNTDEFPAQPIRIAQIQETRTLHSRGLSPQQVLEEQQIAQTIYSPRSKYSSVTEMWDEWVENGIFQLEMASPKWRKSYKPHLRKRFTRMKFVLQYIRKISFERSAPILPVLQWADKLFASPHYGQSLSKFVDYLRSLNDIPQLSSQSEDSIIADL